MHAERRKHPRFPASLPMRFNLNPDHHVVPEIRKMGVGGTVHNISYEGLLIESRFDLLDVCQIFPEALDEGSTFELELTLTDNRDRRVLIRGSVRWYRLSESERNVRDFRAGLYLTDPESRAVARRIADSVMIPN